MSAIDTAPKSNRLTAANGLRLLAGAVVGAILGFLLVTLALRLHVPVKSLPWSDLAALTLGGAFLALGCVIWLISFNRRELARNLEGQETAVLATSHEVGTARLQAASLLLAGLMLLLPVGTMGNVAGGPEGVLYSVIVVLFVLQTVANIRLWRSSDEFLRRVMLNTAALTFAVCQGALFLWAAAEHLHLATPLSSWQAVMILMTIYLIVGTYFSWRSRH